MLPYPLNFPPLFSGGLVIRGHGVSFCDREGIYRDRGLRSWLPGKLGSPGGLVKN